jgi:hypothetical protein
VPAPYPMKRNTHDTVRRGLLTVCVLVMSLSAAVRVHAAPTPEYLIKAAYLYNFALFVGWPADAFSTPDAPIAICIVGSDPFDQALDRTVQNKRINRRSIVVKRLHWGIDLRQCHMLFVSASEAAKVADLSRLEGLPILVVGESSDFARRGGTINFTVDDNKIRFEVNLETAKKSRLDLSAKLLDVATRIVRGN